MKALIEIDNELCKVSFEIEVPEWIHFDIFKQFMIDHGYGLIMGSFHTKQENRVKSILMSIDGILTGESSIKEDARNNDIKVTLIDD